ncbi:MAG: hypothetical protein HY680_07785 [Chloroflexi bacterium]|nr:hypothetical protein [Chloroflexota bacterium]
MGTGPSPWAVSGLLANSHTFSWGATGANRNAAANPHTFSRGATGANRNAAANPKTYAHAGSAAFTSWSERGHHQRL